MSKKKSLYPKLDVVFQALFGEVGSEKITTSLLKAILKQNIEEIDLNQNPILRREFKDDKLGILDILAKINGTDNCNIELQIVDRANIIERMLYYWGRLYTRGIQAGEDYAELVRTVVVLITEFDVLPEENLEIHTNWKIIEEKHRKTILTDKFEFHIIIMSKIEEANLEDKELLDWLYFLDNPESEKVKNIMKTNKELKEAGEKLNKISQDEKLRKSCTKKVQVPGKKNMFTPETDYDKYLGLLATQCVKFPDLNNAELQNSYGVMGADALLKTMLKPGEYQDLLKKIQEINGFDTGMDELVEEAKN